MAITTRTIQSLSADYRKILDGDGGRPSPIGKEAEKILLGTAVKEILESLAVLDAEITDVEIPIDILKGTADGGTYTPGITSGGIPSVVRTAATGANSYWVALPVPTRAASGKGFKPTGCVVNYSVATADVDDVRAEIWKLTLGADGAAPTATVLFGESNDDYDAAHDTAAERGDDTAGPELHRAVVTDAGSPAFLAEDEQLWLRFYVDGDSGPSGVVTLTGAKLLGTEVVA